MYSILVYWSASPDYSAFRSEVKRFVNQYVLAFSLGLQKVKLKENYEPWEIGHVLKGKYLCIKSNGDYCVYSYSSKFFCDTQDLLANLS